MSHKSLKKGSAEKQLIEDYGGFHDVASARQELNLSEAEATDDQIQNMIVADYPNVQLERDRLERQIQQDQRQIDQAKRQAEDAKRQAEDAKRQAENAKRQAADTRIRVDLAPSYGDLAYERTRRQLAEAALYPSVNVARFIENERLKDELKKEKEKLEKVELEAKKQKPKVIVRVIKEKAKKKPAKKKTTKKPTKKKTK